MRSVTRFVGLDVHAETIAVAVAERDGDVASLGVIPNRPEYVRKLIRKLGPSTSLKACYEAGPCGYTLYWQLVELGVECHVVAPTLVPVKAGDRVKTDRRDAAKLARCFRNGDLTSVWVPDRAHEALRDLVRARLVAKQDQVRARNRLRMFLLRHGFRAPEGIKAWTIRHREWMSKLTFDQPALETVFFEYTSEVDHASHRMSRLDKAIENAVTQAPAKMRAVVAGLRALRGVATITAATVVAEVGDLTRFSNARELMSYAGIVPSEHSSGGKTSRGGVTKTGNGHLRRIVVEAAWSYRHRPKVGIELRHRQRGESDAIIGIAWKAQHRLHLRYCALLRKGKEKNKVVAAVGRELLGFIWAIGQQIEHELGERTVKAA